MRKKNSHSDSYFWGFCDDRSKKQGGHYSRFMKKYSFRKQEIFSYVYYSYKKCHLTVPNHDIQ